MTDDTMSPIAVNSSPLPDQLWAAVRQIAPPAMAFAIGKGWIGNDAGILLGSVGAIVWPIVAGQIKTRERAQQLTTIAGDARTPDAVATVKS
jgi:hypothetical protein